MKVVVTRVPVTPAWRRALARARGGLSLGRGPERELPSDDLACVAALTYAFEQPNGPPFYEACVRTAAGAVLSRFDGKTFADDFAWEGTRLRLIEAWLRGGEVRYRGLDWSRAGGARPAGRRWPRAYELRDDGVACERILPSGAPGLCWRHARSFVAGKAARFHVIEWPSRRPVPGGDLSRVLRPVAAWSIGCVLPRERVLVAVREGGRALAAVRLA